MRFTFHGKRTDSEETVTSTIDADNEAAAHDELKHRGIEVIALGVAQQQRTERKAGFRIVRGSPEAVGGIQNPDGLLVILSLLLYPIGFLVGAIFLCQGDPAHRRSGQRCLLASLIGLVLCVLFVVASFVAAQRTVAPLYH